MNPFPENIFDLPDMREQIYVFADRKHAGEILGDMLHTFQESNAVLLGIPAGGVPVAVVIQEKTGADAYKQWSDVTEAELLDLLKKGRDHAL
jgi:predicted phosphoribosyltransferase